MAKSYESLMGSVGRSVFYRPERQRIRELLSRESQPTLLIDGEEFPLFDISMNGVSFLAPGEPTKWKIGRLTEVSVVLHDDLLYRGPARVARAEQGPRGARIGLGLETGFLDLPEIRRQDDERRLEHEFREGPSGTYRLVPPAYRAVVGEIAHFLSFYRRSLAEHERRYRAEGHEGLSSLDLAKRAYEAIHTRWWELQLEASRAALECLADREVLLAAKEYTEALVTPIVLESPIGHRAYHKPLGYAGDYQTMLYYYNNAFEGDTSFGKFIHKFFVGEYPLGVGVRTRKDLIVDLMEMEHNRVVVRDGIDASFRVMSLGCGPAREVCEFIARKREWPGDVTWTLIDQEEDALSIAYRDSRRQIGKWNSRGHLNLLNLSFVQLLSEGLPFQAPASQDLVFSAGLFDYLREPRAQSLIRILYDLLAEDGVMAVGNAVAPNEYFWATEFLVDWTLLYRTREEMLLLARMLPNEAERTVVTDASGAYHFLVVRKH